MVVMCDFRHCTRISSIQVSQNSLNNGVSCASRERRSSACRVNSWALGLFGKYLWYSKVPSVISASIRLRIDSSFFRFAAVLSSAVCSRQRFPSYRKSKNSLPVSGRSTILPTANTSSGHRHGEGMIRGVAKHVLLNHIPDVEDLPAAKRADVMNAFE